VTASSGKPREVRDLLRQMVSYGVIGLGSAGLDALVFWLLISFASAQPQVANVAGVLCGIAMSFSLNRLFTFHVRDKVVVRFAVFFGVGLIGLALSAGILAVGLRLGLSAMTTKACSIVLVAAVQFVLNRSVTFRAVRAGAPHL
jgi:putative flippase GtrA